MYVYIFVYIYIFTFTFTYQFIKYVCTAVLCVYIFFPFVLIFNCTLGLVFKFTRICICAGVFILYSCFFCVVYIHSMSIYIDQYVYVYVYVYIVTGLCAYIFSFFLRWH